MQRARRCLAADLLGDAPLRRLRSRQTIKLGELNSYKQFPAFLEPYKKGMELAVDEINAAGGVLGRQLEVVVARRQRQSRATPCASPRSC